MCSNPSKKSWLVPFTEWGLAVTKLLKPKRRQQKWQ